MASDGRKVQLLAALALATTALLWGSNHVAARAIHNAIPLPALIFWRWGLALAVLLPLALPGLIREREVIRAHAGRLVILGAAGVGLFSVCLYAAAYYSLALEVGLINATTPIWVLLLSLALGATGLRALQVAGFFLALAGVVLVLMKGDFAHMATFRPSIGNLWALFAAMLFAWYTYQLGQKPLGLSALSLTVLTAAAGLFVVFVPIYAAFLMTGGSDPLLSADRPPAASLAVLYIALGPTLLGNLFWIYGASRLGAARAGPFLYLSPLAALVLSVALLGENVTLFQIVGAAAILGGLWLSSQGARKASSG